MINAVSTSNLAHFRASLSSSPSQSGAREARPENRGKDPESRYAVSEPEGRENSPHPSGEKLTPEERQQVEKLQRRDAEVRAHEMAHMAAAGSLSRGGPNYVYQTGPDGRSYAVGGEVKIDTSPGRTPEETIRKAAQIRAAALAPSDPSPQDLRVASTAGSMAAEAQSKLSQNKDANDGSSPEPSDALDSQAATDAEKQTIPQSPLSRAISNAYRSQRDATPSGARLAETA